MRNFDAFCSEKVFSDKIKIILQAMRTQNGIACIL
jgi:hypothetical protein